MTLSCIPSCRLRKRCPSLTCEDLIISAYTQSRLRPARLFFCLDGRLASQPKGTDKPENSPEFRLTGWKPRRRAPPEGPSRNATHTGISPRPSYILHTVRCVVTRPKHVYVRISVYCVRRLLPVIMVLL